MKTSGERSLPSADAKIPLLKNLRIFQSLDPGELEIISRHSGWMSFRKGETIPQNQGGAAKLFAVFSGEVVISRLDEDGREISLATFEREKSFGEISLFEDHQTDTVARCEEDTVLLAFPVFPAAACAGPAAPHSEIAEAAGKPAGASGAEATAEDFFFEHPLIGAKILYNLLGVVAERTRSTNRLIAEKTPWIRELRRKAMVDKLTGLYNKSYLEEDFARLIDDAPEASSLLMMKPDNFKIFNDTYGHDAGDRVLQLMAAATSSMVGDRGISVRFKGDVFAVVLPDADAAKAAREGADLKRAMQELDMGDLLGPREKGTDRRDGERISVCIGISTYPAGGRSAPLLIDRAYENLFRARAQGSNRIFSDEDES